MSEHQENQRSGCCAERHTFIRTKQSVTSTVGSAADLLRCEVCAGCTLLIINSSVGFGIRREEGSLAQPAVTAIYRSVTEKEVDQRRELKSI